MKRCITVLIICFAILSITFFLFLDKKDRNNENQTTKVIFHYDSYDNLEQKYIGDYDNRKVYYVGIDNMLINDTKLEEYINRVSIYDLKKLFNRYIYLRDGGTQAFYCDDENVCDKSIKLIYCNTGDNNTNIYIGELKDEFSVKICSEEVN